MAYRTKRTQLAGRDVEVRSYLDLMQAELAVADLRSRDVPSFVVEAASFNPLLAGAAGGHRVMVDESDFTRADEILQRAELPASLEDDEPEGTVRCPRCELPYCKSGKIPFDRLRANSLHGLTVLLLYPFAKKRWFCQKCEHVWDDPAEGPKAMTRVDPSDPRPVFLLFRARTGSGIAAGMAVGFFAAVIFEPWVGATLLLGGSFLGGIVGRLLGQHVCSEPSCRAPLTRDSETCTKCRGSVAGLIEEAHEHYSAAADFRRELLATSRRPRRKR